MASRSVLLDFASQYREHENLYSRTSSILVQMSPFSNESTGCLHTQNGPATPYSYATVEDWSKVAAQVHADTIPLAIKPGFTLLLAVLNSYTHLGVSVASSR